MRQMKKWKVFEGFDEKKNNGPTDFHQTYVIVGHSSVERFEIKRLKTGYSLLPW